MAEHDDNLGKPEPNPFLAPADVPEIPTVVSPEIIPPKPKKPRVWTAILVPFIAIAGSVVTATIVLIAGIFALGITMDPYNMDGVLQQVFEHPLGIWLVVLPGQLSFLAAGVLAAMLSPVPTGWRLRLGMGKLPVWTWIVFLVATPIVGVSTTLVINALDIEPSEQLKMLEGLMTASTGMGFVVLVFLVAVVPGFVEELLFRGYMQSRLLQRWHPLAAILLSALVFAVAHVDPLHVCAVFPLGIWMGVVAYRAQSIWPAILCHFGNNLLSVIANQFEYDSLELGAPEMAIMAVSSLAMLVSLVLIFRKSSKASSE